MDLVGSLQLAACIRSCRTREVVYVSAPVPPDEAWAPLGALVTSGALFTVTDGCGKVPEALERYRVGR